jgi:DNA (cytosine-5)-methyltransferase 1
VASSPSRYISLFSGVAGLDLAVRRAFPNARCVCMVEGEAFAASLLAARMESGDLDEAPIWSDIRTFDARAWRGRVDCVIGGWPCQPASVAGKQRGIEDERWLWPDVERVLRETEARWFLGENVAGVLASNGGREWGEVLRGLASLGFAAEWDCFTAAEVGAPHRRERVFVVAYRAQRGQRELRQPSGSDRQFDGTDQALADSAGRRADFKVSPVANGNRAHDGVPWQDGAALADASHDNGRRGIGGEEAGARPGRVGRRRSKGGGDDVADADAALRDKPGRRNGARGAGASESG